MLPLLLPFRPDNPKTSKGAADSSAEWCSWLEARLATERALEVRFAEELQRARMFEATHNLSLAGMGSTYLTARTSTVHLLLTGGRSLKGLPEVVLHDSVQLMDRAMSSHGMQVRSYHDQSIFIQLYKVTYCTLGMAFHWSHIL